MEQKTTPTHSAQFHNAPLRRQILIGVIGSIALILFLGTIKFFQIAAAIAAGAEMGEPISAVTTFTTSTEKWNRQIHAVGSLRAKEGALLSFQVGGEIKEVGFRSGTEVQAGDVLVKLDSSIEDAELSGARAEFEVASIEANRARALGEDRIISRSELDAANARLREASSRMQSLEARISQKSLRAPFAGHAGIRRFNIGDFVSAGEAVVPLYQLHPLELRFSLPQRQISELRVGQRVAVHPEGSTESVSALVSAIDPQVNPTTRTFEVEVEVNNESGVLRPGMFVHATVIVDEERPVTAIPLSAIQFAPYGDSVLQIVDVETGTPISHETPNDIALTVQPLFVRIGEKRGDFAEVLEGLSGGETIVSSGTFRLRPGSPVQINNEVSLPFSRDPQVENR